MTKITTKHAHRLTTLAAAIVLAVAAVYLERCCRAPDLPDDAEDE